MIRAQLVSDLTLDLLGPRSGAVEILPPDMDPRQEYQIGQLFPQTSIVERNPDAEAELLGDSATDDEDGDDSVPVAPVVVGQNFRRLPSSFGLSFCLSTPPQKGAFKFCVTWARYKLTDEKTWAREPRYLIKEFDPGVATYQDDAKEVRIDIKISNTPGGSIRVSLFATSLIRPEREDRVSSTEIIFQPEIRVVLNSNTQAVEMAEGGFASSDPEWRISMRQYDGRKVLARGHLCGVYWPDVDPQREFTESFDRPPFVWSDGVYLLGRDNELQLFFKPTFRTDFIPMYSAPAPEYELDEGDYPGIRLSAQSLADAGTAESLTSIIRPFLSAYSSWISRQRTVAGSNPVDSEIIARHENALRRMTDGLEFLASDSSARLAFSFMNEAMAIQTRWAKPDNELVWRPFQIGFILLALKSSVKEDDPDRNIADILWFPTGGGKSESYLGLAAFTAAYRRLSSEKDGEGFSQGEGTAIISRYTLRLLTIQQFRRALRVITAMEYLRLQRQTSGQVGWRPAGVRLDDWIWGTSPFSIGLWVGGNVTPNRLSGEGYMGMPAGALNILRRLPTKGSSDPAQVLNCPKCNSILAVPVNGLPRGDHEIHLFAYSGVQEQTGSDWLSSISANKVNVISFSQRRHRAGRLHVLTFRLRTDSSIEPSDLHKWWKERFEEPSGIRLVSFNSPVRPGYIPVQNANRRYSNPVDYELRCPNPDCELHNILYSEKVPAEEGLEWKEVHPLFASPSEPCDSIGIPLQAITVDEKLYRNPPTMVVGTCDKLAITPSYGDADAASLFGRVRSFNEKKGYDQEFAANRRGAVSVAAFAPPALVIQDELHLLDGPLGSTFGLYETILDELCGKPKYVASSATIRNAAEQVDSIMSRTAQVFPPVNLDIADGFFLKISEAHPLDERRPGRLFLGIAAPGRAAQTPILRIWARLLQSVQDLANQGVSLNELDYFWTLAGYFNAIRELAGGEALWRQDIPQRLDDIVRRQGSTSRRSIEAMEMFKNLSSQTDSSELPGILASLDRKVTDGDALCGVAATSMFGTGVDVDRLSLMVVHGQPKSASSYIQAVGRIGRKRAGLATIFLRVGKPRDLNHYEFFTGYHRRLAVAVEPISVKPLAPRAIDRILGPLIVMLVRNIRDGIIPLPESIWKKDGAAEIRVTDDRLVDVVVQIVRRKWESQPPHRRPSDPDELIEGVRNAIARWKDLARRSEGDENPLKYIDRENREKAVLGEPGIYQGDYAFPNAPTSLREVEATIRVYTRNR